VGDGFKSTNCKENIMGKLFNKGLSGACVAIFLASSAAVAVADEQKNSGFLKDYSLLQQQQDSAGAPVQRYINPKLASGTYKKILIEPVVYYPEAQPSEKVDAATLAQIKSYLTEQLRQRVGGKIPVVDEPAADVVRMRVAIAGVAAQKPGLKPYELVPIGFLVSRMKTQKLDSVVNVEAELRDSVSGELLGEVVKQGVGNQVDASPDAKLNFSDVQPILDGWATQAADFAAAGFTVGSGSSGPDNMLQ
jgi:hypothetical protein